MTNNCLNYPVKTIIPHSPLGAFVLQTILLLLVDPRLIGTNGSINNNQFHIGGIFSTSEQIIQFEKVGLLFAKSFNV